MDWRVVVIDEAHRLKNRNCKLLEGLKRLSMEHRVLLTGTPLQNSVEELFSLLNFLEPHTFPSHVSFLQQFGDLKTEEQVEELKTVCHIVCVCVCVLAWCGSLYACGVEGYLSLCILGALLCDWSCTRVMYGKYVCVVPDSEADDAEKAEGRCGEEHCPQRRDHHRGTHVQLECTCMRQTQECNYDQSYHNPSVGGVDSHSEAVLQSHSREKLHVLVQEQFCPDLCHPLPAQRHDGTAQVL